MFKKLFFFAFVFFKLNAVEDENLYSRHILSTYKSANIFSQESEKNIAIAETLIQEGKSFREIIDDLAIKRSMLPNGSIGFGSKRTSCLFTPGNNYFVMRECLLKTLNKMFQSTIFSENRAIELCETKEIKEPGYEYKVFPIYDHFKIVFQKLKLLKSMRSSVDPTTPDEFWKNLKEQEDFFEIWEFAAGRFLNELPLLNKEDFKRGYSTSEAYRRAFQVVDYISFIEFSFELEFNEEARVQNPETLKYMLESTLLEEKTPGQFIALTRSFLGLFEAQKILLLKHSRAKSFEDCTFVLIHSSQKHIPFFDKLLQEIFSAIKNETDLNRLQVLIYIFQYAFSAQTPFYRGSSSIQEWFVSAIYRFKGCQEPVRSYCEVDQYAQILPFFDFIQTMWEKDGPLKIKE